MKDWTKLTVEMWSQIVEKLAEFVMILWWTLRPKLAILPNFWDRVSTVSFLKSLIYVLTRRPSAVRKYLQIWFKHFKCFLRTEMGRKNVRK